MSRQTACLAVISDDRGVTLRPVAFPVDEQLPVPMTVDIAMSPDGIDYLTAIGYGDPWGVLTTRSGGEPASPAAGQ